MIQSRLSSTEKLLVVWCPTCVNKRLPGAPLGCALPVLMGDGQSGAPCPCHHTMSCPFHLPIPSLASQWLYPALTSDATSPPSWLICSQQALHFPSYLASIPANSNQGYLTYTHSVLTQTNVSSPTSSEALCEMSRFPPSVLAVSQLRTWKVRGLSAYFKKRGRK